MEPNSLMLISFMQSLNLWKIVKSNTRFTENGACIDLIHTSGTYCFKHSSIFETGPRHHHHLIINKYLNFTNIWITKRLIVRLFTQIFKTN